MPQIDVTFISLIAVAYLMGSLSAAIIICKIMGLPDPRTLGSHNPGATNVLRIGGRKAAAITLAGDALKGLIPVLLGHAAQQSLTALAIIGFAAFLGHLYPVFFSFRGGKGVATALGVMVGVSWLPGLCVIATWLVIAKLFKISSLSAIIAASLAPLYFWLFEQNLPLIIIIALMDALLIFRHRSNILSLIKGTEDKIS